jgi:hypothetical protein
MSAMITILGALPILEKRAMRPTFHPIERAPDSSASTTERDPGVTNGVVTGVISCHQGTATTGAADLPRHRSGSAISRSLSDGGYRDRTGDLRLAKAALSQLS